MKIRFNFAKHFLNQNPIRLIRGMISAVKRRIREVDKSQKSLKVKIIALVALITGFAFSVFMYIDCRTSRESLVRRSSYESEILTDIIINRMKSVMHQNQAGMVKDIIMDYSAIANVEWIKIFNPKDGSVWLGSDGISKLTVSERIESAEKGSASVLMKGSETVSIRRNILAEEKCFRCHPRGQNVIGTIDVGVSLYSGLKLMERRRQYLILVAISAVLIISLVLFFATDKVVNKPLKKLADAIGKIRAGDLDTEVPIDSQDELGRLARSFNAMTEKLQREMKKLEALHKIAETMKGTLDSEEREKMIIYGIAESLGFERIALLTMNESEDMLEGLMLWGCPKRLDEIRIPIKGRHGILVKSILNGETSSLETDIRNFLTERLHIRCWEYHKCNRTTCVAYKSADPRCWSLSKTYCFDEIQDDVKSKMRTCSNCPILKEVCNDKGLLMLLMFGCDAFAATPMITEGRVPGVIVVDNLFTQRPITREEVRTLAIFANQAAMAMENARMYRELEKRIASTTKALEEKITHLTEIETFNNSILQSVSSGLAAVDLEGNIVAFNPAAEVILGYTKEEVLGKRAADIFRYPASSINGAGLDEMNTCLLLKSIEQGEDFIGQEITLLHKNGSSIPIEMSVSRLKTDNNELRGAIGTFIDITERKKREEQMRRTDKLVTLGQIAPAIAHEIKNPLAGISHAIQVIGNELPTPHPYKGVVDEIIVQINRVVESLQDLLRYARPTPPQPRIVNINEIVESVCSLIGKQANASDIEVITEYESPVQAALVDPEQLHQVILNIALNGLEAMSDTGGVLSLKTFEQADEDRLIVEISDKGVGIDEHLRTRIFEPYFTTKYEGTGLGLAIAQRIIEAHNGTISVKSKLGEGATFTLSLPKGETKHS